ncbi:LysE family translocator [Pedobacter sp. MR2016-24]|uniref:LysE family translocator n=1 Tax=Pedobacter sp. MR2016-24 TaxID=2994466 RepID=UPI0022454EB7|nr:LysE family translocator [Pedobacter sp. MR2016-24]MCX2484909.1 LysE family translocator [Pedobacter sp. MR2016-24]
MGIINYLTFVITAFIFIITPGIDTIFILNKSIAQGKKAGIYSLLGLNTGVLGHTLFAALGLSLIIAKSVIAFSVIKYLGAAYLIYLGVSKLLSKESLLDVDTQLEKVSDSNRQNFVSGFFTNILNPKVALFFLAFFPQFIAPELINDPKPFIILGLTCAVIGSLWFLLLTLFASYFSSYFKENPKSGNWLNKITGLAFVGMGLKIALSKR